jgi:hypothetical protein
LPAAGNKHPRAFLGKVLGTTEARRCRR